MYEIFEHTADMGLRVRAASLDELFAEAARALFSVVVANLDSVRPVEKLAFEIDAEQLDVLLRDWLAELLFVFHTRHMLFGQFEVRVLDNRATAAARGEPIDKSRHQIDVEVKAVTYHGLKVERQGEGWLAEVILDI